MSSQRPAATFVFDGGCGFCAWAADWLAHLTEPATADSPAPLAITSSRDVDFASFGEDPAIIRRYALYVPAPDGGIPSVAKGAAAIGRALRFHGRTRPWRLSGAVLLHPLARIPAAAGYRIVALSRPRLGPLVRWVGAPPSERHRDGGTD